MDIIGDLNQSFFTTVDVGRSLDCKAKTEAGRRETGDRQHR